MPHAWHSRCVPLDEAGLLDVLTRARARDREDHLQATGTRYDPMEVLPLALNARWGALIHDANARPQAAVYAVPGVLPGDWLACISATDGWRDVWRTAVRFLAEVLVPSMLVSPDVRRALVWVGDDPRALRFAEMFGLRPCATQVGRGVLLERVK